jgi:hypothetical protein
MNENGKLATRRGRKMKEDVATSATFSRDGRLNPKFQVPNSLHPTHFTLPQPPQGDASTNISIQLDVTKVFA